MNDRWKDIEAIVDRVLSEDPVRRPTIIAEACAGDADLRREVESLLKACEAAGGFLENPALAIGPQVAQGAFEDIPVSLPERIAGFRIQRVLGVGGMGVVYVAEQDRPHRTVALKVIKPGLATPSILRRFEHEAEVLGRLHHPGIAQVYEADTAEGPLGPQPFFAMELIDGKPITTFAIEHGLDTRERLELLARVCDAVQHAHQQGVIHRDLKPSNVLVESSGQPKILDFGVARVSRADGSAATVHTQAGQIIGTLAYMSPEQAAGDSLAVDTRSDVYSLGVVAYQLLSGKLPVEIGDRPLHEGVRAVHEQEPAPLSSVNTEYRGDIDTVIGKSLHKDRDRRYQSAAEFAADLRRVLANEPVLARPPSALYQLSKFAQRHRALVGGVVLSAAVLVLATVSLTWMVLALEGANDRIIGERNAARTAEAQTRVQLDRANSAIDFISSMFESLQPYQRGRDARVLDTLNGSAIEIDRRFADQPLLAAELHLLVGRGYRTLNELEPAEEHLRRAVSLSGSSRELNERLQQESQVALALVESDLGRHESAVEVLSLAATTAEERFGTSDGRTLSSKRQLVDALQKAGKYEEAVKIARATLVAAGPNMSLRENAVVDLRLVIAADPIRENRIDESAGLLREILDDATSQLGATDPETLKAAAKWCAVVILAGRPADAVQRMRGIVDEARAARGDSDFETQAAMLSLANALAATGAFDEAEAMQRDVWHAQESMLGEGHPLTLMTKHEYARMILQSGDVTSAVQLLRRGSEISTISLGKEHPLTIRMRQALSAAQSAQDAGDSEIAAAKAQLASMEQHFGKTDANTLSKMYLLLGLLQERSRWMEANDVAEQLVQRCSEAYGPRDPQTASALVQYGFSLAMLTWIDQAEPVLVRAYDLLLTAEGDLALLNRRTAVGVLAVICDAKGEKERAQRYRDALSKMPEPDLSELPGTAQP
jgi:serine/threonine protein kinase/tetratricopeptide (TPR) repeat protein